MSARETLKIDEFEFVAAREMQRGVGLRRNADPVDAGRRRLRAVGLDANLKPAAVQRFDERVVHLQQGLAASQHDVTAMGALAPRLFDGIDQRGGVSKASAAGSVHADKIGIAETANR